MTEDKEFNRWLISKVLPSIRKNGTYNIGEKDKKQLKNLNEQIRILKNQRGGNKTDYYYKYLHQLYKYKYLKLKMEQKINIM